MNASLILNQSVINHRKEKLHFFSLTDSKK